MNICKSILGLTSKTVNLFQDDTFPALFKEGAEVCVLAGVVLLKKYILLKLYFN